jgi:hypothetical protein
MLHIAKTCLLAMLLATVTASISRAEITNTNCGAPIQSSVATGNELFETTSRSFVRIRGAVHIVTIPLGQTRCVKVRFTGGVTCKGSSGNEVCFIRARAGGEELFPDAGSDQRLSGRLLRTTGLGFQWVGRLGEGQHVIQIQVRSHDVPETITVGINDWTMDVEVLN